MTRDLKEAIAVIEAEGIRVLGTARSRRHVVLETDIGKVTVSASIGDKRSLLNLRADCRRAKERGTFAKHPRSQQ